MLLRMAIPALLVAACQPAPENEQAAPASADAVQLLPPDPAAVRDIETADGFADLFGLPRLSDGAPDELRIWSEEYVFGNIHGTIVTPDSITRLFVQDSTPGKERRSSVLDTATPSPVLARLSELAAWNGRQWMCLVADGAGLFIDGVSRGKRFTFSQVNAHDCDPYAVAQLGEILDAIGDVPREP